MDTNLFLSLAWLAYAIFISLKKKGKWEIWAATAMICSTVWAAA